jgi:hypothetical protein
MGTVSTLAPVAFTLIAPIVDTIGAGAAGGAAVSGDGATPGGAVGGAVGGAASPHPREKTGTKARIRRLLMG